MEEVKSSKKSKEKLIDKKSIIKLVLIFLLFYFGQLIEYIPIILFRMDINSISYSTNILLSLFSNLCILIILLLIYRKSLKKDFISLKRSPMKMLDTSFKYYFLGLIGMVITNLLLTFIFKGGGSSNEKIVQEMIDNMPYLMILNAGIVGPIIEELVFRKPYLEAFKNKYMCIIFSGIIFGLLHVITTADSFIGYMYFLPYAFLGFGFACMDYKQDNIFPSIIMHMFHNTLLVLLSIL